MPILLKTNLQFTSMPSDPQVQLIPANFRNTSRNSDFRGTWVAQSVKRPTLDFGSDHDLMVSEFKPHIRLCADSAGTAWDSLSSSVSAPPPFTFSVSLSK